MSLSWHDVRILYRCEMRSALRERTIVINTFLIPIFMYPLLLWALFTGITYVAGQTEGLVARVAVHDRTGEHQALRQLLEGREKKIQLAANVRETDQAIDKIKAGELDALLELLPVEPGPGSPAGDFSARLYFDQAEDRSEQARQRVQEVVELYRSQLLEQEAAGLGITGPEWQSFTLERRNVASSRQMGTFILSSMLPLFLIIMIAVGCFYPSVDATAGERERSTWETTMSSAASRSSIVTAKYLYVATLGSAAGLINLAAMILSAKPVLAPLAEQTGETFAFRLPLLAVPVMAAGTILLALFIAAVMMLLASFARTFREGQSLITPFYMAILLPVVLVRPEGEFTPFQALIPIVNVSKLFAQAINGSVEWLTGVLTLLSELVCVMVALRLASSVTRFEDFMIGSYNGSFGKFVRERLLTRKVGRAGERR